MNVELRHTGRDGVVQRVSLPVTAATGGPLTQPRVGEHVTVFGEHAVVVDVEHVVATVEADPGMIVTTRAVVDRPRLSPIVPRLIRVVRTPDGGHLEVDGERFPWATDAEGWTVHVDDVARTGQLPGVTVRLVAERVEVVHDVNAPQPGATS